MLVTHNSQSFCAYDFSDSSAVSKWQLFKFLRDYISNSTSTCGPGPKGFFFNQIRLVYMYTRIYFIDITFDCIAAYTSPTNHLFLRQPEIEENVH